MTTIANPATDKLTGKEIVDLCKKHTLYEWSAQSKVDPIPVASAKGIYFYTPEGKRYIDFNSQLMSVNIGHGDQRVVKAIAEQAATLAYANPFMATEVRARLGAKLAELTPGDIDTFFFTNGGAEATENAIKLARFFTGRHKIMARYRSYHGATAGSITLTGDPRRWAAEPGIPGVVHVLDPYHGIERGWESAESSLAMMRNHSARRLADDRGLHHGNRGRHQRHSDSSRWISRRRAQALRQIRNPDDCRRSHGWLRTHRRMVRHRSLESCPDLICMAKGLTSSYIALGAVGMRHHIAQHFQDKVFYGGLTYNSHPMGCAAALATIRVYEEDGLIENAKKMGARYEPAWKRDAGETPVGWGLPVDRIVRHLRTHSQSPDQAANGSFQRHVRRDGHAWQILPSRDSTHWYAGTLSLLIRRCASTSSSCARHLPLSIAGWRSRIRL